MANAQPVPILNVSVRNALLAFLGGVVIGGGAVWLWFSGPTSVPASSRSEIESTEVLTLAESVSVENQPAGITVSISSVTLAASGWVAIHENEDGQPGNILGAQRFDAGTHASTVDLLRATVPGGSYFAMLHRDNGDGAFSPSSDAPITGPDGKIITAAFAALNE